jgi:hypothetical protein
MLRHRMDGPLAVVDHRSIRLDVRLTHAPEDGVQCVLALGPLHEPVGDDVRPTSDSLLVAKVG